MENSLKPLRKTLKPPLPKQPAAHRQAQHRLAQRALAALQGEERRLGRSLAAPKAVEGRAVERFWFEESGGSSLEKGG